MGAVQVVAKPDARDAFQFDGTEDGAKALRDWAQGKGAEASFFWARGSYRDNNPSPAVRVGGVVLVDKGSWLVLDVQWRVLLPEQFDAVYTVVLA